jgi:hypothetical protein
VPRKGYIQPAEKDVLIANTYKIENGPASFWRWTTTIPKEPIRENIAKVELSPDLPSWKDSLSTICF